MAAVAALAEARVSDAALPSALPSASLSPLPSVSQSPLPLASLLGWQLLLQSVCESLSQLPSALGAYASA